jgi:PTS system fructose-specific IIC component
MIPFVAAGGILIALGFLLGTIYSPENGIHAYDAAKMGITDPANLNYASLGTWAFIIFWLGKAAFAFFVPVLAGYIAFAIADRPGLAPGFVAGALATGLDGNPLGTGTGFLGAILGGALAGIVALWASRWSVPSWIRPLMPVVIIPLVASIITGLAMVIVLKAPVGWLITSLNGGLASLSTAGLVVLGLVLGLMMAFDMGGPVNKVAYTFATTGLAAGLELAAAGTPAAEITQFKVMAIVMAAGMVPPIGMALATVLNKKLYDDSERENGKAAWLLGASFISEGAIPFAAADPTRVIPSIMAGSAVTGALVGVFQNTLPAPHGGIFVIALVGNWATYLLAIAIGAAVTAVLVNVLKGLNK